ncbi:MAG: peptidoglycan DD-metalloendopeptidase family protein [Deltaproteobacteria bacterium]|nr:peptidoglycan DD-metalloendopeptidase family protein [Deltaproteobacteria bacterium]
MRRRKRQNVYVQGKRRVRIRLFILLTLLLAVPVILVVSLKPGQQPSPTNSPTTFYVDRFAEKKNYRQSIQGTVHTIKLGDNLYQVLVNYGVKVQEVGGLIAAWRSLPELQKLRPGEILELIFARDSQRLEKVRYQNIQGKVLATTRTEQGWTTSRYAKPVVVTSALARGAIKDSLYQSAVDEDIDFELALALADIFAWDIDFFVDLRAGDHYAFLYDQRFRDGELVGNGRIVAAHFHNGSTQHRAYYYQAPGKRADYYDDQGNSLRKVFLKSPLRYSRISSGFSKRRLHPILKIYRPHPGVDYAAPTGTPVVAVGDGRVISRRWKNGYGRFIAIRHNSRYITSYGHLYRYASKIKVGSNVKQGQVIGYVGASGLATGPHLDFRMKKDGRFVNPLKNRLPAARPVPPNYLSDFKQRVASLEEELAQTQSPQDSHATLGISVNQ